MTKTASPGATLGRTQLNNELAQVVVLATRSAHKTQSPHNPEWGWQTQAACRDSETNSFYTETLRGMTKVRQEAAAKRVCAGCPVIANCLKWALKTEEPYGVWGGMTPDERAELLSDGVSA
jgi:WhiB family redox-sensing transcriptional regulator